MIRHPVSILLHNIRSVYNVGSIFRTADAAGVEKVWMSGYTPLPVDRFGRERSDIKKAALGAEKSVTWEYQKTARHAIEALRKAGYHIVGVEQSAGAVDYRAYRINAPTCFIFGNEVRGLSSQVLAQCDAVVEIPMHGEKESLNVSVAAGIMLFHAQS